MRRLSEVVKKIIGAVAVVLEDGVLPDHVQETPRRELPGVFSAGLNSTTRLKYTFKRHNNGYEAKGISF